MVVPAFRLPCSLGGRAAGRLWGRGSRQSACLPAVPVQVAVNRPSGLCSATHPGTLPSRVGDARRTAGAARAGVEDPALALGDHGSAVRRRAVEHGPEGGRDAGTEHAGFGGGPAVKLVVLDRQAGPHVVLEVDFPGGIGHRGECPRIGGSLPATLKSPRTDSPRWTQAVTDFPSGERLRYVSGVIRGRRSRSAFTSTFRTTRPSPPPTHDRLRSPPLGPTRVRHATPFSGCNPRPPRRGTARPG